MGRGAFQPIVGEVQFNDAIVLVCGDAIPGPDRIIAQPIVVARPAVAGGGLVEGDQGVFICAEGQTGFA